MLLFVLLPGVPVRPLPLSPCLLVALGDTQNVHVIVLDQNVVTFSLHTHKGTFSALVITQLQLLGLITNLLHKCTVLLIHVLIYYIIIFILILTLTLTFIFIFIYIYIYIYIDVDNNTEKCMS